MSGTRIFAGALALALAATGISVTSARAGDDDYGNRLIATYTADYEMNPYGRCPHLPRRFERKMRRVAVPTAYDNSMASYYYTGHGGSHRGGVGEMQLYSGY